MELTTERLLLRPWKESDAESLYQYAKDERVGPIAGWPAHRSVEESREVIRDVFMQEGVFAVTLKGDDTTIGCIGVIRGAKSNFPISEDEGEVSAIVRCRRNSRTTRLSVPAPRSCSG